MTGFVHLRLHTEYSLVDGVVRVDPLMAAVSAAGMPAVAMTDRSNLFALVKFHSAAQQAGIKPLVGVDLLIGGPEGQGEPTGLTLLVQDALGFGNLSRLISRAWLEGQQSGQPVVDRSWLTVESLQGLLALSGGREGDVGRALLAGHRQEALVLLQGWRALFGDRYYLEVCRTGREHEEACIEATLDLIRELPTAIVATNDVRFIAAADFEAHEARVCIHSGQLLDDPARPRRYSAQQYLKTPEEMARLFADLPEALENTVEIARRCSLELELGRSFLPDFPVPAGQTTASFLREQAAAGLSQRLPGPTPESYQQRLQLELDVICQMGFEGYFLIVADFIRWAREHGVPVGPGRGSGAGSLVAWVLGITDLDPLVHDLLFERFLNPERVSMPDFDIDFCMERRDRVIDYVADRYGRDRVSQIITFGTMAAKAVVRDAARVLGHPYGLGDGIAKLVPFELGITLDAALDKEPELKRRYESEDEVRDVLDLARSLEGLVRNAGTHAGGVVIAPSALTDFTPLYSEASGQSLVTQLDKDDVEKVGLVKFDFLGLRTLTIIDWAVADINESRRQRGEPPLEISQLPLADERTFALLKACRTTAIFQLESRGMRDLVRRLQPDRFEDVVALVALFRPGPLQSGMVDDFIARKHGRGSLRIDYLHPDLEPVLKPTYGVILYQEQVMQIAQVLAGYTLGGADLLRRAMGKKKPEEMARQRSVFVEGAKARHVPEAQAAHIFDLMEKFAGYGFNKSHSAAYALLSYQTAWLKAHYPASFMAAVLSADMDNTDKVVTFIDECTHLGLQVLPPDVNVSGYRFRVEAGRGIRYGLGAVKGVGEGAVEALVEERDRGGPFAGLADLCQRIDLSRVGRKALEALIRAGCLDALGPNRATLFQHLSAALQLGEQRLRASQTGQVDLFGLDAGPEAPATELELPAVEEWSAAERLQGERDTLGLFLTGHPINAYERELSSLVSGRIVDLVSAPRPDGEPRFGGGKDVVLAGLVLEVKRRANRTFLLLDDRSARIEAMLFDDVFQEHREILKKDAILLIEGQLRWDDFQDDWRVNARKLTPMDQVREREARKIMLRWPANGQGERLILELEEALRPHLAGECGISLHYERPGASATISLGEDWRVKPTRELIDRLSRMVGPAGIRVVYGPRLDG